MCCSNNEITISEKLITPKNEWVSLGGFSLKVSEGLCISILSIFFYRSIVSSTYAFSFYKSHDMIITFIHTLVESRVCKLVVIVFVVVLLYYFFRYKYQPLCKTQTTHSRGKGVTA